MSSSAVSTQAPARVLDATQATSASLVGDRLTFLRDGDVPLVISLERPGDAAAVMGAVFGDQIDALELARIPWTSVEGPFHVELLDAVRAITQQWGNSVIDNASGLANLIGNAPRLLTSPRLATITDVPAIAIGAGPSLDASIEAIQRVAHGCIIVAAESALPRLIAAGIHVDACTPLERLRSTAQKLDGVDIDRLTTFCGNPFVLPGVVERFGRAVLVPSCDRVFDWYVGEETPSSMNVGPTSGTMAVSVALALTCGPVYVVGLDSCGGYSAGATVSASLHPGAELHRIGVDGQPHATTVAWLRQVEHLAGIDGAGRCVNVAAGLGMGLPIAGMPIGALPAHLPALYRQPMAPLWDVGDPTRLERFRVLARALPGDLARAVCAAAGATQLRQIAASNLLPDGNGPALAYLCRGLYAQCSVMRRTGHSELRILRVFREALENIVATVERPIRHACSRL